MLSRPGYVGDFAGEMDQQGHSPPLDTEHAAPSLPVSVPLSVPSKPSASANTGTPTSLVSSVRNTVPFSPEDEREARWKAMDPDMASTPPGRSDVTEAPRDMNFAEILADTPQDLSTEAPPGVLTVAPAAAPEGATDLPAPAPAGAQLAPALLPRPSRIPPDVPLYAPSELYCQQCQRPRPPRAHHCRRCGQCVLRMDHHCPWIGGCVGAHNYQYYFCTVAWGFAMSLYVLVSVAVLFSRGVRSFGSGVWSQRIHHWRVDGYMISVLAISLFFALFTGSLVTVHTHMSGHNLTSIEQRAINSFRSREGDVLKRYYSVYGEGGTLGNGAWAAVRRYIARRRMLREWNTEWGYPHKEGNPWWIANASELEYALHSSESAAREEELEHVLRWPYDALPLRGGVASQSRSPSAPLLTRPAFLLNMEQSLGPPWGWCLPITRRKNTGVHYPLNPRYSPDGLWRPRSEWPEVVRAIL